MGQLTIDVKSLEDRRVDRKWHVLQPKPTLSKKNEARKLGKLELAVRWKHNPDRVIQLPEAFHHDDLLDQPANYLQICLVRARKLKVMDKSRLTSGGSSDPLVHFSLDGESVTSTIKKKNLRPVWSEYFELPIEDEQQILEVRMEDFEQFSANQVMGRCNMDMSSLKGRETFRKWLELVDEDGKDAGWVEIALRWAHDAKRVLDLPDDFTEPETEDSLSKEANELLVCLLRGKNLPVMDKSSSDPCAFLNLDGEKRKSRVVKKNINPQWMQTFRFPCDDGLNVTLQCGNQPAVMNRHRHAVEQASRRTRRNI
jgi:Ca2+-dependent lipid-binding protein